MTPTLTNSNSSLTPTNLPLLSPRNNNNDTRQQLLSPSSPNQPQEVAQSILRQPTLQLTRLSMLQSTSRRLSPHLRRVPLQTSKYQPLPQQKKCNMPHTAQTVPTLVPSNPQYYDLSMATTFVNPPSNPQFIPQSGNEYARTVHSKPGRSRLIHF
ncbi:hypothetical protein EC991_002187 [Linnemannia zychae]|nr:hypothetical protein EC991_002187 [Linnemannia zychae]